jgi:hypothetical protein
VRVNYCLAATNQEVRSGPPWGSDDGPDQTRQVNWRRGFLRLWVAGSAVWVAGYGYYLWTSRGLYDLQDGKTGQILNVVTFHTRPWSTTWMEPKDFSVLDFLGVVIGAAGPPVLALTIGWCIWWVSLGFKT